MADHKVAVTRTLSDVEFGRALREKLFEECAEAQQATDAGDLAKELADVLEVVYALAESANVTLEDLEMIRQQRSQERGAFRQRIWLEETYPKDQ